MLPRRLARTPWIRSPKTGLSLSAIVNLRSRSLTTITSRRCGLLSGLFQRPSSDAIKKKLNKPDLQVKLIPVTSQNRIPLLQNGTFDFECGSTTNNLERQKQAAFSDTIFGSVPVCWEERRSDQRFPGPEG
ncbi:glutamate and aspartate transporter subunit [Klebsiella pneumoniae]|uniref:Glutamate and aspartate transporter subunit n=1 Tax=Klebsiella pneumoniae TaxID=573 RepID=A0A4P0Y0P5_KLEPN|nr:glutamate and aspartate transporter subunit [Klebsiella pneumoniae]